ncbi:MAG: tRNA pseudouridine(38-40) synthase TruA [Gemmatimonadaceae bacterium]|jgi:tRNA pseudouridine38-40 synthase|nr:tRNA pseudouridine(38-40) synthase TruA [Gemmatimonadaceae bacterium]
MSDRAFLLTLAYDGTDFAGWQRQRDTRTVQGELERLLERLGDRPARVTGAGRTDAGVHATGQAAGVVMPASWTPATLKRAVNGLAPRDLWVQDAREVPTHLHPRYDALSRRYRYLLAVGEDGASPFRRRYEWHVRDPLDLAVLNAEAAVLIGDHGCRAFAVARTAPADDPHRCLIHRAAWREREGGLVFDIEANRFLHHMVRFLVGTMIDVALGRRPAGTLAHLLTLDSNQETSAPAPAHGLYLEGVRYPAEKLELAVAA